MLKIAIPNKGSLSESAVTMLKECGYRVRRDTKELVITDVDNDIEFFYLRPRDIAVYVGSGTLHAGITGRDLLLDSQAEAIEIMPLGFASSTFRFAARPNTAADVRDLGGKRIATSYPGLVRAHLGKHDVEAEVVRLDGAVETSITLGVADVIADVVETGTTLRNQGLETFGAPILHSEAVLVARHDDAELPGLRVLARRLGGVVTARTYVLVDYDVRAELVDEACAITPGLESPTVSPLHDRGYVAVRSMVKRQGVNRVMDALYELGARGILVTEIRACRL
ncbi:ATP phosphoribosyltransferase [Kineosphaera limosa]|uniref:ATP phosphoribosyltransferase n=1 Tax=Kineosphaera limosa NBRC 100340 TaxID=1184609 RepID=K6WWN7_9MICO|nr:ATP phosphoribosyltransferase [Kineosphaera limosa]NYD99123.1 ATP phosphoribosyltransferase [Kineosphaera limosa]GAB96517.1 ATP phosphoribosyltransferase [Kineosphaera limosa NBRC 100340]